MFAVEVVCNCQFTYIFAVCVVLLNSTLIRYVFHTCIAVHTSVRILLLAVCVYSSKNKNQGVWLLLNWLINFQAAQLCAHITHQSVIFVGVSQ